MAAAHGAGAPSSAAAAPTVARGRPSTQAPCPLFARRSLGLGIGERRVALLGLTIVRNIAEYGNLSGFAA